MIDLNRVISAAVLGPVLIPQPGGSVELRVDYPVVSVRDTRTGFLLAYSSSKADFESSLEEFTRDYLP